jgi:hypothetical protein
MKKYNHEKDFEKLEKDTSILLKLITGELERKSAEYRKEGIHGGHVGTYMDIRLRLRETLASMMFTANCEEEKVYAKIERLIKKAK